MNKAFLYRAYPTTEQVELIRKTVGSSRFIYNKLVEWGNNAYAEYKKNGATDNEIPLVSSFKDEFEFLKEVDDYALANARRNYITARKGFFDSCKGKRKGKKLKPPVFKSKNKAKWSYRTSFSHNNIRLENGFLRLPKIGMLKLKYHRELIGRILSATVTEMRDGTFYVSVVTEVGHIQKQLEFKDNPKVVGLDMSMDKFYVSSDDSDNTKTTYVRQYRSNEKRRHLINKSLSRKKDRSKNRDKARRKLAKFDRHISNCRLDFCHKESKKLVQNYDVIVLEDINMQEMGRRLNLGKSVNDLGFGMFRNMLGYKSEKNDCLIVYADKWFPSSKLCSHCGYKNTELKLSDREWVCPECGEVHDRDFNAACNLRDYYFNIINTAGTAEIQACGDKANALGEPLMEALSLNQEAPSFRVG